MEVSKFDDAEDTLFSRGGGERREEKEEKEKKGKRKYGHGSGGRLTG